MVLEVATALGALLGLVLTGAVPDPILYGIFTAVLLVSAIQMMTGRKERAPATEPTRSPSVFDGSFVERDGRVATYRTSRLRAVRAVAPTCLFAV